MNRIVNIYQWIENGEVIAEGSSNELADFLGMTTKSIQTRAKYSQDTGHANKNGIFVKIVGKKKESIKSEHGRWKHKRKKVVEKEPTRLETICRILNQYGNYALKDKEDHEKVRQQVEDMGIKTIVVEYHEPPLIFEDGSTRKKCEVHYHLEVV